MSDIPMKVVVLLAAEVGVTLGMGIILYHSSKAVITASLNNKWGGFRSL